MKKLILALFVIACLGLVGQSLGAEKESKAKIKTITGTGLCAKCSLKESDTCQNVIQVERKGKKTNYYLAQNDVSKKFHEKICKAPAKVKAVGEVKAVNGRLELTPTEIELVNK